MHDYYAGHYMCSSKTKKNKQTCNYTILPILPSGSQEACLLSEFTFSSTCNATYYVMEVYLTQNHIYLWFLYMIIYVQIFIYRTYYTVHC